MDKASTLSSDERMVALIQDRVSRPMIPAHGALETLHIGDDELPWMEFGGGTALQMLHVDLNQGLWISKTRMAPGTQVPTHFHTGLVFAVTLKGTWHYLESPEAVNRPGSYLFEPAGSRHTLVTPADATEDMVTWFAIYGANITLDEAGNPTAVVDAKTALDLYRDYCDALGLDYSKLIIHGEVL
jgi:quercetin dioxygenase-like cupin family protein